MSKGPGTSRQRASEPIRATRERQYRQGETIPNTGLYNVFHHEHRLPSEVTLRKGETFPHCDACTAPVTFNLVIAAPAEGDDKTFKVVLHALPVLDEPEEDSRKMAV